MTTGPTKIPVFQTPGTGGSSKPSSGPNALIEKLPLELSDVKTPVKIKGLVIRQNPDGSVRVRTNKGDIDIRPDPKQLSLRPGDEVEIDIPAGKPPQTVRVTPDAPLPPRPIQTPVDIDVDDVRPPNDTPLPPPPRLIEGVIVRLESLPPEAVSTSVSLPVEAIVTTLQSTIENKVQIIAQNAVEIITSAALKISTPPLIESVPLLPQSTAFFPEGEAEIQPNSFLASSTLPPQPTIDDVFKGVTTLTPLVNSPARAVIASLHTDDILPLVTPPSTEQTPALSLLRDIGKPFILNNQKAGEIPALVVGTTPQNLPVIGMMSPTTGEPAFFVMHLPDGTILPGTPLTLIPQDNNIAANPASFTATVTTTSLLPPSPAFLLTPSPWPVMDEIYQTLLQIMPMAAQAMARMTPSPTNPAQLGATALFFIAAVRGGDLTEWLGNSATDSLRRAGKSGLLSRLTSEGSTLGKLASEPVAQDWRGLSIPMFWENQMHKITLYYKNDGREGNKDQTGKQMRFVFDLNLDVMGKVQVDGLFRHPRLDLIVRSLQPFSRPMQEDMRRLYAETLSKTAITGELSFQNDPEKWVTITPESGNFGVSA